MSCATGLPEPTLVEASASIAGTAAPNGQQISPSDILYKDGLSLVERGLVSDGVQLLEDIFQRYEVTPYASTAVAQSLPGNSKAAARTVLDWFFKRDGQDRCNCKEACGLRTAECARHVFQTLVGHDFACIRLYHAINLTGRISGTSGDTLRTSATREAMMLSSMNLSTPRA